MGERTFFHGGLDRSGQMCFYMQKHRPQKIR